jgi:hypothetical protein
MRGLKQSTYTDVNAYLESGDSFLQLSDLFLFVDEFYGSLVEKSL